jgi:hypothetical protein
MITKIQKCVFSNIVLKKNSNQAYELGRYAINFL